MATTVCTDVLTPATPRIERLRARALARVPELRAYSPENRLAIARSWWRTGGEISHIFRRGVLAGDLLRNTTPVIEADELLVGKFCPRALTPEEQAEVDAWARYGEPALDNAAGQRSHMAVDYPRLLREGIVGIQAWIARARAGLDMTLTGDLETDDFYRACLAALDGVVVLAEKYADHADTLAAIEPDAARAAELHELARICRKVPQEPAETFHEAVQAVHFLTFCLCTAHQMLLFQLGRPDRYLLPYYRRDLAAGRLTPERAQELLDNLGILLNEYTPRGLAVGWMVGGYDEHGVDVTNELTFMSVQAVGHIRMAYPGIGVCWTPDTPPALLQLACQMLARGYSHPALFNDVVITRGLRSLGLSHRDACQYIHSTCVEITPVAISNVYVASPYYNLTQCLHDVLGIPPLGGVPGPLPEIPTFDALLDALRARISAAIREGVVDVNRCMASRRVAGGFPLLSCFVNDCLAAGTDIDMGGARANWIESSFVGLANLADALAAIRQTVYEDSTLTLAVIRTALLADFQGNEDVRARLAAAPKYGTDDDRVDGLVCTITAFLQEECARYRSYWNGPVVPGFFCWIMHESLGRQTCASADGRRAGFPFADGSGPAQGREILGPTAAVCSSTKWDHAPMIGGIAVNMRFSAAGNPDALTAPMGQVLETFLRLGGFEAQVNVVDTATLRAAQARPDQYRDLVVRVAGYSDYFVGLSPEMQAEILLRTEMEI
jgi:formate C-acetyltransferase